MFAASAALAGPLLKLYAEQPGGFHFAGGSSTGKTTALHLAGSVLGGGGKRGFLHSWRSTSIGLESIAEAHNDLTLILDELSRCDARKAGRGCLHAGQRPGEEPQQSSRRSAPQTDPASSLFVRR